MCVKLVVEKSEGHADKAAVEIVADETVVGRHRDCTLRIPSAEVSRRHCILRLLDGLLRVEDLDSLNGTYVNGERVAGSRELNPGDQLEIGPVTFSVVYAYAPVPVGAAVAARIPELVAVAAESATVDIKAMDTGIIDLPTKPEVVRVAPIAGEMKLALPDASTKLEH